MTKARGETKENVLVPLNDLSPASAKCLRVNKTTHGVTTQVGTVGVHLTSPVITGNIEELLTDEANDLDVVGGFHELDTLECTCGDDACATTGFGTPRHHLAFGVSDERAGVRRTPETEV